MSDLVETLVPADLILAVDDVVPQTSIVRGSFPFSSITCVDCVVAGFDKIHAQVDAKNVDSGTNDFIPEGNVT